MPSDAEVQAVYDKVLAQYGGHSGVNGVDIGYAGAEKVVRVHISGAPADGFAEGALPGEIDGVKIVLVKASYGPEG